MNIVYNCNDAFAVHTAVSIVSLFENNRDSESISIYILGNALSDESAKRFAELSAKYSSAEHPRSITIIDLKDYGAALKLLFGEKLDTGHFDITALARLFAPMHLPDNVDAFAYIDADTVVTDSIEALFDTELGSCICGMVPEPTIYRQTREALGFSDDEPYFNSGVILIDRRSWEANDITAKCIDYYSSLGGNGLDFPDQDILNVVLKGRIKPLWQGYNFFSNYRYFSYEALIANAPWYADIMHIDSYYRARSVPSIVHFAGAERPWLKGNFNPYRDRYEHYLSLTPWRGTKPQGGREFFLLAYHIMNLLTDAFPWIRRLISGMYIRKLEKSRKSKA